MLRGYPFAWYILLRIYHLFKIFYLFYNIFFNKQKWYILTPVIYPAQGVQRGITKEYVQSRCYIEHNTAKVLEQVKKTITSGRPYRGAVDSTSHDSYK